MQIRTFEARTFEAAQTAVREALGVDALILGTEETASGVRITAAIEPDDDLAGILEAAPAGPDPRLGALMAFHGVPPGLRAALAEDAGGDPLEVGLVHAFRRHVTTAPPAPRRLLLGLPGHGKTLATARLARSLTANGHAPRVLTLCPPDAPPDGRLGHWLQASAIPFSQVRDRRELAAAAAAPGPLVVDTPGLSPLTTRGAAALRELVAAVPDALPTLVLSTEGNAQTLLETAADFLTLGCRAVLATKLDLTRRYGGLVALACGGVALLPASVSGAVDDPLAPLQPAGLARLLVHRFDAYGGRSRATPEEQPA